MTSKAKITTQFNIINWKKTQPPKNHSFPTDLYVNQCANIVCMCRLPPSHRARFYVIQLCHLEFVQSMRCKQQKQKLRYNKWPLLLLLLVFLWFQTTFGFNLTKHITKIVNDSHWMWVRNFISIHSYSVIFIHIFPWMSHFCSNFVL